jgi:hypothetical protein
VTLSILSCGIFQPELEKLLPEIIQELNFDVNVSFVPPALHVDYKKLADGITDGLEPITEQGAGNGQKILLLYGSMCHPDIGEITRDSGAIYLKAGNCIEAMLSPERKSETDKSGKVFYMTAGWLKYWKDIFQGGMGWDTYDARMNMGFYDQITVLDSGIIDIADEDLMEFYEFTQIPVDVEPIDLDHFKRLLLGECRKLTG